jgi:LPXTG-motif cell wall-anchored protein
MHSTLDTVLSFCGGILVALALIFFFKRRRQQ